MTDGRERQIAETLARHGLGFVVEVVGLGGLVPFHHGLLGHERRADPYRRAEHLRLALQDLGPCFVKLGQLLSTRSDLLPPDITSELAQLQDAVPPVSGQIIRDQLRQSLGEERLSQIVGLDPDHPLASASLGQAHAARLRDGTEVVVKVRRPGVKQQVETDLRVLRRLSERAALRWDAAADYDLVGLTDHLSRTIMRELDYEREARAAERFRAMFAERPAIHIPRVIHQLSDGDVLTLERIRGTKVSDVAALDAAGIDRHALALRATRSTAEMIFEAGFFHADPHPGNLIIEADGTIGLIDFGMTGELTARQRADLSAFLAALTVQDHARAADALIRLAPSRRAVDRRALAGDLGGLLARQPETLAEFDLARFVADVLALLRRYAMPLTGDLALLAKVLIMVEGLGRRLDPALRPQQVLAPYARELLARELSPAAMARQFGELARETMVLGREMPETLRRVLGAIADGEVDVHLHAGDLELLMTRAERLGNRVVAGVLAAALIQALAQMTAVDPDRWRPRERPLFAAGAGATGVLASYVIWSARRGTRRRGDARLS